MLYGSDDRYFAFKALPYGGEHDHYDRLALSFKAFGKNLVLKKTHAIPKKGLENAFHHVYVFRKVIPELLDEEEEEEEQ